MLLRWAWLTLSPKVWDSKPKEKGQPINWVELKTSAEIRSQRDMDNFERKLMKFWIQSFLLGVPKIIVGFRTQSGQLVQIKEFQTEMIPGAVAARSLAHWDGDLCVNFTSALIECKLGRGVVRPRFWM